jgi:predicted permease
MKNIGLTLLYTFFATIQIVIYYGVGIIGSYKKILPPKANKAISELLLNFFMPIFGFYQLANMATWPNVKIMWILILSVLVSMICGYLISRLFHKILKLDKRFERTYSYFIALPSLGNYFFNNRNCSTSIGKGLMLPRWNAK